MKKFLIFVMMSAMALIGCGKEEVKEEGKLTKVQIVLDWTPNTNHTGIFVAKEKGYFEENGLDVEILPAPEGSTTQLIGSGKSQFGISFQDELGTYFSKDEKLPVTVLAAILQHNTSGLISLKEKNIQSFKDLEGKTYGTWDSPIEQGMLKYLMSKEGADFSKVNVIPYSWDVVSALKTNTDAAWIFYAWDGIALENEGIKTNFLEAKVLPELDYYTPVIIGNNDFIKNNPEVTEKFISALKKGYMFAVDNAEEATDILIKNSPELKEKRDFVLASQKWINNQYVDENKSWGIIDQNRWDAFYQWLYDSKVIDKQIEKGYGFTNEFNK